MAERERSHGKSQSLDQQRAAFAWGCVRPRDDKYENLAKSAPALIMSNGLMQTLAFLKGKNGGAHKRLCEDICTWLVKQEILRTRATDFSSVMNALSEGESADYMRASEEALELLRWIRQLAGAV